MNVSNWLYGYFCIALLHLVAITADLSWLWLLTKPLLMPLLLAAFLESTRCKKNPAFAGGGECKTATPAPGAGPAMQTVPAMRIFPALRMLPASRLLVAVALFFSWLGDVFLLNSGDLYFMAGLASFLTAHLFYIFFFLRVRRQAGQGSSGLFTQGSDRKVPTSGLNPWVIIMLLVYVVVFYYLLFPHLAAALRFPVLAYAVVIALMFIAAWHSFSKQAGVIIGAALFIVSDSLLAVNAFVRPFEYASLLVMITYIAAQGWIVTGAAAWLNKQQQTQYQTQTASC